MNGNVHYRGMRWVGAILRPPPLKPHQENVHHLQNPIRNSSTNPKTDLKKNVHPPKHKNNARNRHAFRVICLANIILNKHSTCCQIAVDAI